MTELTAYIPLLLIALSAAFYLQHKAIATRLAANAALRAHGSALHSRPAYHGLLAALVTLLLGGAVYMVLLVLGAVWIDAHVLSVIGGLAPEMAQIERELVLSDARALFEGNIASNEDAIRLAARASYGQMRVMVDWALMLLPVIASLGSGLWLGKKITAEWRARNKSEAIIRLILMAAATIAVLTTIGIVLSLIFETLRFFQSLGWRVDKFLFGLEWSPLAGVHDGHMDANRVGAVPLFLGTFLITIIAMCVAVPIGLFAAIYLSEFASKRVRAWAKPMLELLAGIPTVVYGFFAAITVAPFIRNMGEAIGLSIASESALAAGVVMGIMIIPFISSLSDDVINAVPQSLRDGSYGIGATKAETIRQVILPAALPGIVSAVLLGMSRAIGETMIVVMAAGQGANLTVNPLEAVTTVTVQIVMLITGDTDAQTAAGPAFTLGFTLFCITLLLNIIALRIVRKYRELYD